MNRTVPTIMSVGLMWGVAAASAMAQTATPLDQRQLDQRYQIGVVERVLEQAVEHGATRTRNRIQSLSLPPDVLMASEARVRGFRQEGYGVFFDVVVPDFDYWWTFRMLDQSGLGLDSALQELRTLVAKTRDVNAEQALKRIELQVAPVPLSGPTPPLPGGGAAVTTGARTVTGSAAAALDAAPGASPAPDPILGNPNEAYRAEIREALIDAMLQHSRGLNIAPGEWLHVAAKRNDDRTRLAPVNTDDATLHIRVRGADLTAFLGGQIDRDEAVRRMEVKVF
jgi:hypothetical protein